MTPADSKTHAIDPFDYVLPVRIDHPSRMGNLVTVLRWLHSVRAARPIVVEQDERRHVDARTLTDSARCLFDRRGGPFNKSRAMNLGFGIGDSDVVVFGDADIVMPPPLLLRAVAACRTGAEVVNPYRRLVDLSESDTANLDPTSLPRDAASIGGANRRDYGENLCLAGGAFVIRRDFFLQCGGMDEAFHGWGGEDDAFSIKAGRLAKRPLSARGGSAFHLWHPRSRPPPNDAGYVRNSELVRRYETLEPAALAGLCDEHRRVLERRAAGATTDDAV